MDHASRMPGSQRPDPYATVDEEQRKLDYLLASGRMSGWPSRKSTSSLHRLVDLVAATTAVERCTGISNVPATRGSVPGRS